VPRESWVWQELILSQIELACSSDDEHYKENLDRRLKMLQDNNTLSTNLVVRCIAMLVIRYAQCSSSKPEHPSLRDAAIKYIGNPWLKRTAWDAHVKDKDGHPHEDARDMINGWIKRELIKNFFELLSEDGSADQRRLKYWLRFEPVIEDMWFALGPHAYNRHSHNFKYFEDFRNRAKGRLLKLEAPGLPQNNAFIMKIGPVTVVEFGLKGNATYMYHSETLPFDLSKLWIRGDSRGLKNQQAGTPFSHRDSKGTGIRWEAKLDKKLCPLIDFWPTPERILRRAASSTTQSSTPLINTIAPETQSIQSWEMEIRRIVPNKLIEDNRSKGGAFWVRIKSEPLPRLIDLGFTYKPEKGWWKE